MESSSKESESGSDRNEASSYRTNSEFLIRTVSDNIKLR